MRGDPARPIHLVKEPVHHHQQHDQRRDPGRGLHVELAAVEPADQPHHEQPRPDPSRDRRAAARDHRPAIHPIPTQKRSHHRRQHQNRLEPLTEHQNRAIDHHRGMRQPIPRRQIRRIRRPPTRMPTDHHNHHRRHQHHRRPHIKTPPPAHLRRQAAAWRSAGGWNWRHRKTFKGNPDWHARAGSGGSITQIRAP